MGWILVWGLLIFFLRSHELLCTGDYLKHFVSIYIFLSFKFFILLLNRLSLSSVIILIFNCRLGFWSWWFFWFFQCWWNPKVCSVCNCVKSAYWSRLTSSPRIEMQAHSLLIKSLSFSLTAYLKLRYPAHNMFSVFCACHSGTFKHFLAWWNYRFVHKTLNRISCLVLAPLIFICWDWNWNWSCLFLIFF